MQHIFPLVSTEWEKEYKMAIALKSNFKRMEAVAMKAKKKVAKKAVKKVVKKAKKA
jgi:hypothetical protein